MSKETLARIALVLAFGLTGLAVACIWRAVERRRETRRDPRAAAIRRGLKSAQSRLKA